MANSKFSWSEYQRMPIIGIIRGLPKETIFKIADVYAQSGFTNLEVTMNTPEVAEVIATLRTSHPNINIGAGTVRNLGDLDIALNAGAQFIVSPVTIKDTITACDKNKIPIFAGAYSPTEIYNAWDWGASAVKVFPANNLGPQYMKNVMAPLDNIKLVPTGGINLDNINSYFEVGVFGVGLGSALFDKQILSSCNYDLLSKHFLKYKSTIEKATTSRD